MKLRDFKSELGIPTRHRTKFGMETVVFSASVTLTRAKAKELVERMEADDVGISVLCRRLIEYYLSEHDSYGIAGRQPNYEQIIG